MNNPRTQLSSLQVTLPNDHQDPNEYTARPENADHDTWHSDNTPGLPNGLARPLKPHEHEKLAHLDRLKYFLATAPSRWDNSGASSSSDPYPPHVPSHPALNRFLLPSQEYVTCVLWNGLYHITGTDIVRALVFRFEAFGRPVRNMKKFEEGVFSDLRNLKPGQDACLEEPKVVDIDSVYFPAHSLPQSPFLDLLFKYQCIRTQKKQKVFYWFSVPHDRLFLDALERDLKREKMGLEPTTVVVGEPASSFVYDGAFKRSLYEQFVRTAGVKEGEGDLERIVRGLDEPTSTDHDSNDQDPQSDLDDGAYDAEGRPSSSSSKRKADTNALFFNMFSLFEGSPTYKQRRKKTTRPSGLSSVANGSDFDSMLTDERGRFTSQVGNRYSGHESSHSVSSVDRYPYPQYASSMGDGYMPQHPSSSPPVQSQFSFNAPVVNDPYGGYPMGGISAPQIKQEPISAADMFLRQARGQAVGSNLGSSHPNLDQKYKRHSYNGFGSSGANMETVIGVDTTSVPVWLEGKFAGVGMAASLGPHGTIRHRSVDDTHMGMQDSFSSPGQLMSTPHSVAGSLSLDDSPPRSVASVDHAMSVSPSNSRPVSVPPRPGSAPVSSALPSHPTSGNESPITASTKAYACPLLSCGRLFKRMEHLKRHLRTHTLERPFACPNAGCGKRFSRSDNLGQHERVCRKAGDGQVVEGEGAIGSDEDGEDLELDVGEWINTGSPDANGEDVNMDSTHHPHLPNHVSPPVPGGTKISAPLGLFGGEDGVGMGMGMGSMSLHVAQRAAAQSVSPSSSSNPNSFLGGALNYPMELCEVELTGEVTEVQGDEEGLLYHSPTAHAQAQRAAAQNGGDSYPDGQQFEVSFYLDS
ncbi:hypothetical protein D9758_012099 [Tetrapyrgos nigripes]|uniref:C2H2-type domain-containing protein n=1 Tax=Tetrapyrgos nigripes TaxID=182062 RepID=A0A8H5CDZ7_9AGAR|nr:hypothetical protein D9758_012099 [Tetrapyrgos nigripes]